MRWLRTAFAGLVRATMTPIVMIFEITRNYAVIVPLMISNLVRFFITSRLQRRPSIYEVLTRQDCIHLPTAVDQSPHFALERVSAAQLDIMPIFGLAGVHKLAGIVVTFAELCTLMSVPKELQKELIRNSIKQKVNEASGSEAQPIFTGKIAGKIHPTCGRTTIYRAADRTRYLRAMLFTASNSSAESAGQLALRDFLLQLLESRGTRSLKGNLGDQNYDLRVSTALTQYQVGALYWEKFHALFGVAKMEEF
jgi:hypothetical protein